MTRFRVCGNREVLGHMPGEEFDADISEIQEWRLVTGGHIERVAELGGRSILDVIEAAAAEEFPEQYEGEGTAPDEQPDASAGNEHEKE